MQQNQQLLDSNCHGFTLLEMVVVMMVLSIIAGLTAPIFSKGLTASNTTTEHLQTMEKLRYAGERLAREIRQVNHNGVSYDIVMGASTLTFTKDDTTATNVTIAQAGDTLTLSYSTPNVSGTLTDQVSNLVFNYYDADGNQPVDTTTVAFVEFELTLQHPDSGGNFTQRTRVALRDQL